VFDESHDPPHPIRSGIAVEVAGVPEGEPCCVEGQGWEEVVIVASHDRVHPVPQSIAEVAQSQGLNRAAGIPAPLSGPLDDVRSEIVDPGGVSVNVVGSDVFGPLEHDAEEGVEEITTPISLRESPAPRRMGLENDARMHPRLADRNVSDLAVGREEGVHVRLRPPASLLLRGGTGHTSLLPGRDGGLAILSLPSRPTFL
jgi:hypothetical protein